MEPDARTWRPQSFGRRRPKDLLDPVIEPAWEGVRVLAHLDAGGVSLMDTEGDDLAGDHPLVVEELLSTMLADELVVDGYLTTQALRTGLDIVPGVEAAPGMGEHVAQFFLGKQGAQMMSGRGRGPERAAASGPAQGPASAEEPLAIAFVAIDLVALDGQPLLDLPLLERKRLLESVLPEGAWVRRTPFVREPASSFIVTWRSMGFGGLAYKEANSRYHPGAANDDWSLIDMPRR
jgi:ATP-dependent DNA ligase